MTIKQLAVSALLTLGMVNIAQVGHADEASLKKAFEKAYPKAKVKSVTKTPYGGLYEVFMANQIVYTDEQLSFIIVDGQLVDAKTKTNVTSNRFEELTRIDFNSLPLDKAIKVVKGNGKRKIAVFSDVDCPFCKRLEQNEFTHIDNVTIYTFLYPIDQLHPDARAKSKSIWCASDRVTAWNNWIFKNKLPAKAKTCKVPLETVGELANRYGVSSTPTLFFGDGKRLLGAQPHETIEAYLKSAEQ